MRAGRLRAFVPPTPGLPRTPDGILRTDLMVTNLDAKRTEDQSETLYFYGPADYVKPHCRMAPCDQATQTLAQHLGRHIGSRLRTAEQAFSAIGAQNVATVLRQGQLELGKPHPHAALQQLVAGMEASLARIDEPVDNLIELYAIDLSCEHLPRRSQLRS
jgi:hypothetical protein